MFLVDLLFFILLFFIPVCFLYFLQKRTQKKLSALFIQLICSLISLSYFIWIIGLVSFQKGTFWYETIRLPLHFTKLFILQAQENLNATKIHYGTHPNQYFLHLEGKDQKTSKPCIFFIHGGGWTKGSPYQHTSLARKLNAIGYDVVLPAYRLTPEVDGELIEQDICKAFKKSNLFLVENGKSNEFIIGGVSAGANLACNLSFKNLNINKSDVNHDQIKGVFSICGALNLNMIKATNTLNKFASEKGTTKFKALNPINHIDSTDNFPFLSMSTLSDGLTPVENIQSFTKKLKKINKNVDEVVFNDLSHIALGSAWYYEPAYDKGQLDSLKNWLNKLNQRH